jgi:uncharacterized protein
MLFKIISQSVLDKEDVVHYYNNETNEIFDAENRLIDIAEPLGIPQKQFKSFTDFPVSKTRVLSKLKVQLGLKCNLNCSYCSQAESRSLSKDDSLGDVESFIASLRREELSIKSNGRIEFWGGEPLVYIKTLRKLVPELRKLYPTQEFHMISNGTLLTKEIVDWLVENKVSFIISHDAQGYALRDDLDPLYKTETKLIWLYAKEQLHKAGLKFGFNVVITRANCDIANIPEFFQRHFSANASFGFEGIVQPSREEDMFRKEDIDVLENDMKYVLVHNQEDFGNLVKEAQNVLNALAQRRPLSAIRAKCEAPNSDVLVVDLKGNVISCQNFTHISQKIGELNDYDNIKSVNFVHWSKKFVKEDCKSCPVVQFCKGGCPLNLCTFCRNDYVYHMALFKAVWFLLFQADIKTITPIQ